jgi:hypothetical protein
MRVSEQTIVRVHLYGILKVIGFYQLSGVERPDPLVTVDEGRICLRTASTQKLDLVESVRIFV